MQHTEIYKSDLMSCKADTSHLNIHYSSRRFSFIYKTKICLWHTDRSTHATV